MADAKEREATTPPLQVTVRPLREDELDAADHIVRLAFGTFLGLPDPLSFMGDGDHTRTRWRTDPAIPVAAEVNGELAGTNFITNWGSVGFFGPLSVHPKYWNAGVAQHLLRATVERFDAWGVTHAGLCTFPHSTKHIHLYQKFDFWPRYLTPVMGKDVGPVAPAMRWSRYSEAPEAERASLLADCRQVTGASYPGLDLAVEIGEVERQRLGDTVLLWDGDTLAGLAICHTGPGTEAGSGICYVKFGAVFPGAGAGERFSALLEACESFATSAGQSHLVGGVNQSHHDAYRRMLARGFRASTNLVIMERSNEAGYNRPDVYIIDDWR
jgi:GNAT superfamily N-acetyltransferase